MSEKERLARKAVACLYIEVAEPIAADISRKVEDALDEYEDQLHSLRMAVLEFFTVSQIQDVETDHYNPKGSYDLALSAGIEFKDGQWKLKEEGK